MIQRIQTLYLLVAFALLTLLFFIPIANYTDVSGQFYKLTYNGLWQQSPQGWLQLKSTIIIEILLIAALTILAVSIIGFKNRVLQIKQAWISMGLSALVGVFTMVTAKNTTTNDMLNFQGIPWGVALPWIAILLINLAIKAIRKDENLVKSVDRLR